MKIERCPQGHFFDAHRYAVCPLCSGAQEQEPEPALPQYPTVGWVVCTQEPWRGRDFRLHSGYNLLGSGPQADVCIPWDTQLSPAGDAIICYDQELKLFSFGPRGGGLPVRVNGKMVMDAVILNPGDRLTVGDTALLFVPLCGKDFRWEVSEKRED